MQKATLQYTVQGQEWLEKNKQTDGKVDNRNNYGRQN